MSKKKKIMNPGVFLSVALAVFLIIFSCILQEEESGSSAVDVTDMRFTNEIQNWSEESYVACADISALASTAFNGEAWYYENYGLGKSIFQTFDGGTNRKIKSCVMEFPAESKAETAYSEREAYMEGQGTSAQSLNAYDKTEAVIFRMGADFESYANFGKFLIKLSIYGLQEREAYSTAESFYGAYKKVIEK